MELTFPIEPASNTALWVIIPACLILLGILGVMAYATYSLHNLRVVVREDAIEVRGGMYGRRIPVAELRLEEARIVDLGVQTDYALRLRTNGIGLPGYSAGWFRMRNGGKALAFVTKRDRVVVIPTRRGYTLLLSLTSAERFLAMLKTSDISRL